jgi:hypothetical protein
MIIQPRLNRKAPAETGVPMGQFGERQAPIDIKDTRGTRMFEICCAADDCDSEEDRALQQIPWLPRPFVTLMQ